jgi:hypothetical protein
MRILCAALTVYLLGTRATPKETAMTTLDIIAALIVAVNTNDTAATPRLLEQLEARLPTEEVIEILEAITGDASAPAAQAVVACA